jgi:hypothetical protein
VIGSSLINQSLAGFPLPPEPDKKTGGEQDKINNREMNPEEMQFILLAISFGITLLKSQKKRKKKKKK